MREESLFILDHGVKGQIKFGILVHLSRSHFLYINYLVSVTDRGQQSPQGHI